MNTLENTFYRVPLDAGPLEAAVYKSALWNTGVIELIDEIAQKVAANDGRVFTSRFWRDLPMPDDTAGTGNVNYPDDSDTAITANALGDGSFSMHKNGPNTAFGEKDIIRLFGFLDDPLGVVVNRLNSFWGRYLDQYALAQIDGVIADNIANDGGDMVNNISDATSPADDTNSIDADAIIDTLATSGDAYEDYNAMSIHSKVMARLRKQNLIDVVPASDGSTKFYFYQDLRVIVSDNNRVDTSGDNPVYQTIFMGPNIMGTGFSDNGIIPIEIDRDARSGKGAGETVLISRNQFALHPLGFSWTDNTVTGSVTADASDSPIYPNMADNALAVNWDRIVTDRKQVKIAVLKSNG